MEVKKVGELVRFTQKYLSLDRDSFETKVFTLMSEYGMTVTTLHGHRIVSVRQWGSSIVKEISIHEMWLEPFDA